MIPKKVLKAIGKVLKHNGNHVDHHLRNLMQEIETHLAQNPLEENKDATTGKVQHSTVRSNQVDKAQSLSSNATIARGDQVNRMMSSTDNTTSSAATIKTRTPPSDVAREKERVERNRVRKGRYIESEEEDDSTDSTDSNEGDALDGDDYIDDSNDVYMEDRTRRNGAPLAQGEKRVEISHNEADEKVRGKRIERKNCSVCYRKVASECWLTNCGHLLCDTCQARPLTLAPGSHHQCRHCGFVLWEATPIRGHALRRYQEGCRVNRRFAANPIKEGQYAL